MERDDPSASPKHREYLFLFQLFVILYKLSLYNGIRVTVAHEIDKVDNFAHFTDVVTEFSSLDAARWSHTE